MPDLPQLAWPLRQDSAGGLVEVEQDTIDDVRQCINVLLHTPPGSRPLAPDVGIEDQTFTRIDTDALTSALEDQEDRALVTVTVAQADGTGEQQMEIAVALAGTPADEEPTE